LSIHQEIETSLLNSDLQFLSLCSLPMPSPLDREGSQKSEKKNSLETPVKTQNQTRDCFNFFF
jgi:hypothetical protein